MKTSRLLSIAALGAGSVWAARLLLDARRRFDVYGRVVLITGGSRGLGLVLARELGAKGARVVICARDVDELREAEQDLRGRGVFVRAEQCDVTSDQEVRDMLARVVYTVGEIEVLVNNAAMILTAPNESLEPSDYDRAMELNFRAPLRFMLAVLPGMRRLGHGRIVNVSSFGGQLSVPHLIPYCASKHALTGLSEGFRAELQRENIFVTTVSPGMMRTGSHVNAEFKGQHAKEQTLFSLGNANPLLSVSAEYAVKKILRAMEIGRATCTIGWSSHLAKQASAFFPEATAEALALVNRILPKATGNLEEFKSKPGSESSSFLSPSVLTTLSDNAAEANNERRV